jgi:hypothetical protein
MDTLEKFPEQRLMLVETVAAVLYDLAEGDDNSEAESVELMDQLIDVGEIILDGLGAELVAYDETGLTVKFTAIK